MAKVAATRYHDISCGHRVVGHEGKCANLHGHNYRVTFSVECHHSQLDKVGRVIDFSVIKSCLCMWLENNWDHKFLVWVNDPQARQLREMDPTVVVLDFNPTAENMAQFLLNYQGPKLLQGTGCRLTAVTVEETRKCSATASL